MSQEYFVLYKRDLAGEKMEKAKGRMLYDLSKEFAGKEEATAFALSNLHGAPIVARKVKALVDYEAGASYVVAAHFKNKYYHYSYDGDSDPVPTNEVVRCSQENLDAVVEELARESPSKIYLGIEERILPNALDWIKSVNERQY